MGAWLSELENQINSELFDVIIIEFTQDKFPEVHRSLLIDAVNDKCANYRRPAGKKLNRQ